MNRRTFIFSLIAAGVATSVPIFNFYHKHRFPNDPLLRPHVLANFCDGETIRDIGLCYRRQVPSANEEESLREILLTKENGDKVDLSREEVVNEMLDSKVVREFEDGRIVVEDGWILSETEARQCALYSLDV